MKKKIILIDMPFSLPECAAFGITQIKSFLDKHYKEQVDTQILYLTHDFYNFLGEEFYKTVNTDFFQYYKYEKNKHMWIDEIKKSGLEVNYFSSGLGDWFFRHIAFPNEANNTTEYFKNIRLKDDSFKTYILEKRKEVSAYLDMLIDKYKIAESDIVGFTSRFQQQGASIALAQKLKKINSKCMILMGGPNCEPPAGAALAKNITVVDYILSGRRFLTGFGELVNCILQNNIERIDTIPGVYSYKSYEKRRSTYQNEEDFAYEMSTEDNISDFIDLDYQSYFDSQESHHLTEIVSPVLFLETSRGCAWGEKSRCTFCAIDGYNPNYRTMKSEQAIKYLNNIFQYADKCKYFIGTDSCFPKHYLKEVFPYINIPEDIHILYEARVDYTEEEMALFSKYHIDLLIVGIESLSNDALKLLNKGTTVFDNIKFLKYSRKYSLNINWNILAGIPGETDEMILENANIIPYIYHLYPPTGIWLVSFQGNCEYCINPDEYGIKLKPALDSYKFAYPFDQESLEKMTYFKDISNKKAIFTPSKSKSIYKTSKCVNVWKSKWRENNKDTLPNLVLQQRKSKLFIVDTRGAERIDYEANDVVQRLIMYLDTQVARESIYEEFSDIPISEIDQTILQLEQQKIILGIKDTYISMVII